MENDSKLLNFFGKNLYKLSLPQLVMNKAIEIPDNIAVLDEYKAITYSDLETASDKVAAYILQVAGRQQKIAVIMDRSADLVAAALGIMKSSSIYVPIDTHYPQKRVKHIVEDCQCPVIIIQSKYRKLYADIFSDGIKVICYEDLLEQTQVKPQTYDVDVNNIAYILYTSGTTGKPKGVMVTHKAVLNTLFWLIKQFKMSPMDVIALKTSISFTDSIWEIFCPLIVGAKIKVVTETASRDINTLYIAMQNVTITQFVPSALRVLLAHIARKQVSNPMPNLRWVFNTGEYISTALAKDFYGAFKNAELGNLYGMTESAIFASYYLVNRDTLNQLDKVPIGRPIDNIRMYIVNDSGSLCEAGEIGEICISGIGLASGYWNQSGITKEKFCYCKACGEDVYRTGDLGAIGKDGMIDYFGRKDDQVKIRGNRVELAEVEKSLMQFVHKGSVAVIVAKDKFNENTLICFYTDPNTDIAGLRSEIAGILPVYMVPSRFEYRKELPLSFNSKVDRNELRKSIMDNEETDSGETIANQLMNIWKVLLPASEITPDGDFFDLGGDSLLVIRMQAMLDIVGFKVDYDDILKNSTINQLVKVIKRGSYNDGEKNN
ncbi:MAG: amino acid adenylation domain-containing protein [Clostridia bacterium]|nr:amino acid adenylation domain-containing protein [Clostridia bacterium]